MYIKETYLKRKECEDLKSLEWESIPSTVYVGIPDIPDCIHQQGYGNNSLTPNLRIL